MLKGAYRSECEVVHTPTAASFIPAIKNDKKANANRRILPLGRHHRCTTVVAESAASPATTGSAPWSLSGSASLDTVRCPTSGESTSPAAILAGAVACFSGSLDGGCEGTAMVSATVFSCIIAVLSQGPVHQLAGAEEDDKTFESGTRRSHSRKRTRTSWPVPTPTRRAMWGRVSGRMSSQSGPLFSWLKPERERESGKDTPNDSPFYPTVFPCHGVLRGPVHLEALAGMEHTKSDAPFSACLS